MPGCVVAWKPLGLHLRPDSGWPDDIFDLDLGDIVFQFQIRRSFKHAIYLHVLALVCLQLVAV